MQKIVVLGAGGHAKVILDMIQNVSNIELSKNLGGVILLDDRLECDTEIMGCAVKGTIRNCSNYREHASFIIGIGDNKTRKKIAESYHLNYMTLVHPSAVIGCDVTLGEGTVVMAGAVINSGSRIGRHCIVNTGATVDHDCILHDFVHISPGAHLGGTVEIGQESWIGLGSCVKNNVSVGAGCIIGAGGIVVRNIIISGTYVGNPVYMKDSR